ncbi:hypothetical protein XENTR_v10014906 [Xenopus tropicalis]|nr:hypothetical protein XENTR_v10014906 [Xenopus tropicalis]
MFSTEQGNGTEYFEFYVDKPCNNKHFQQARFLICLGCTFSSRKQLVLHALIKLQVEGTEQQGLQPASGPHHNCPLMLLYLQPVLCPLLYNRTFYCAGTGGL